MSTLVETQSTAPAGITRRRRERLFFTGMSVAIVITVFAGFAPSYYLKSYFGRPPLSPLLHLHGIVFSSWLVLFIPRQPSSPPIGRVFIVALELPEQRSP